MAIEQAANSGEVQVSSPHLRMLAILAVVSACLYAVISFLSWRFDVGSLATQRPIVAVLLLFTVAFIVYLFAIRLATRAPQNRHLLAMIILPAILFRVTLLLSVPIQEIDIYRYLWDGAVSVAGVSPFRYSPQQVRTATTVSVTDEDLLKLLELRDHQPAVAESLDRVHFAELPTIYPPVSQWVFAAAAYMTPANASVMGRVLVAKAWFIGFDLATLLLVVSLLRMCRKPVGLCLTYAWCPLLLKEVANSGHLDAVAVFLTTLAIYFAARIMTRRAPSTGSFLSTISLSNLMAVTLSLAIGAKLYPIVLAPLLFGCCARRLGWGWVFVPAATFAVATLLVLWPMMAVHTVTPSASPEVTCHDSSSAPGLPSVLNLSAPTHDPSLGVRTFLRRWEMNDFIFLLLVENLKPTAELPPERITWFSVLPESVRQRLSATVTACCEIPTSDVPFLVARAITVMVFLVLVGCFAWQAMRANDSASLCAAGFLTLAWFWLLCPTQNPWYWTWALPLLPFARSRVWLAVSGFVLLYYLRFWFGYHWPETPVLGTRYAGSTFFDFVVTWFEFAPWLTWLAVDWYRRSRSRM